MRVNTGQIEVVDAALAKILRDKSPMERLQIAFEIWESARKLLTAYLHQSYPEWDEKTVQRQVAKRLSHGAV